MVWEWKGKVLGPNVIGGMWGGKGAWVRSKAVTPLTSHHL